MLGVELSSSAHPTPGAGPGRAQTVSCAPSAPGTIQSGNISLCTKTLWVISARMTHGLSHFWGSDRFFLPGKASLTGGVTACAPWEPACVIPVPPQEEAPRKAAPDLCKLNKLLGSSQDSQLNHK